MPLSAQVQTLTLGEPTVRIGVADGPTHSVFDYILDVAVDARGNIYVVDDDFPGLRVFDTRGNFVATAGRRGEGPGEFRAPQKVAIDAQGRSHVLDTRLARITTYELSGSRLELKTLTRLTFGVEDLCTLGERRFVKVNAFASDGLLIREIASDGAVLNSFGERWTPEARLRRLVDVGGEFRHNVALLLCHAEANRIFLVHQDFGLVRAFTPEGREVWRTFLPEWRQQRYALHRNGSCCAYNIPDPASGTYHFATAAAAAGPARLSIAVVESTGFVPGRHPDSATEVRVVDVSSGQQLSRSGTKLGPPPFIRVLAMTTHRIYAVSSAGFPQVVVFDQVR